MCDGASLSCLTLREVMQAAGELQVAAFQGDRQGGRRGVSARSWGPASLVTPRHCPFSVNTERTVLGGINIKDQCAAGCQPNLGQSPD